MLTPHIRRPPPLLLGTRGPWHSSVGGDGGSGWNGNGDLGSNGGPSGGGSEEDSGLFGSWSSTLRGSKKKDRATGAGVDEDGACGEGRAGDGERGFFQRWRVLS